MKNKIRTNGKGMDSTRIAKCVKFIEVDSVMKLLNQGDKSIGYDIGECNLLLSDTLRGDNAIVKLEKEYRNIEDLMNSSEMEYFNYEMCSINMSEVQTPILKYKNNVLIIGYNKTSEYSGFGYSYILTLIKPNKVRLEFVYGMYEDYVRPEPQLSKEDSIDNVNIDKGAEELRKFIRQNLIYPISARSISINEDIHVIVGFSLYEDLTASDFEVYKVVGENISEKVRGDFENEALRVAKLIHFGNSIYHFA